MIAGHAPLAFALAASLAVLLGAPRRRALLIGLAAGGFAVVPDVDVAYAVVGVLGAAPTGVWSATEAFWSSSSEVHRGITHSLALAGPAVAGFGLAAGRDRVRLGGGVLLVGLLLLGFVAAGPLGAAMTVLYVLAGLAVVAAVRRTGLGVRAAVGAAAVGLFTHPFGDLFTGEPPHLFYPLGFDPVPGRLVLLADPTLNLLSVFALELACVWLGVLVAGRLLGVRLRDYLDRQAVVGAGYGVAALVLPAPTMEVSYHFVFSAVGVGLVGVFPLVGRVDRHTLARGFVTGFAAVTLAGLAYAVTYLLV